MFNVDVVFTRLRRVFPMSAGQALCLSMVIGPLMEILTRMSCRIHRSVLSSAAHDRLPISSDQTLVGATSGFRDGGMRYLYPINRFYSP